MKNFLFACALLFMLSAIQSCKEDDNVSPTQREVVLPLAFSDDPLIFTDEEQTRKLVISNNFALQTTEFSITNKPSWLVLSSERGSVSTLFEINATVQSSQDLNPGITRDTVEFFTVNGKQYLGVEYRKGNVSGSKLVGLDTIKISEFADTALLEAYNITDENVVVTVESSPEITLVSTVSFEAQQSTKVSFRVDRSALTLPLSYFEINLKEGTELVKKVIVEVAHYTKNKIELTGNVVDAKYNKATNLLYFVTENPSELQIFDATNDQLSSISLPAQPLFVSISKSGGYGVVAYDGSASLINMSTSSIINTFSIGTQPSDVVLKDSSYAYFFPNQGTHVKVNCVNLQNNYSITQSTGQSISDESRAVLHPSGDYIYVADNGVSPSDVEKLDIRNGVANRMYDSPYHGTYYFNGKLWLSEDGNRIFTRGKTVLNTSTTQSSDMIYGGKINLNIPQEILGSRSESYFGIDFLDYSDATQNIGLVAKSSYTSSTDKLVNQVYIHDGNNLQHLKSIDLESYLVQTSANEGVLYDAVAHFCFFNSSGTELIVLTKGEGSGLVNPWGIEKFTP